ncbi:MAG: hypothetical protein HY335_04385, partial [Deinococcus sp.]|nr:hypothetical protein [Deinococcus sp.]
MATAVPAGDGMGATELAAGDKEWGEPVAYETSGDEQLVAQAKLGDRIAFEELVRRYAEPMLNLAHGMLGSRDAAWDVVQESFLATYRVLRGFRGEATFYTYLRRVVTNACLKEQQRRRGAPSLSLDTPVEFADGS